MFYKLENDCLAVEVNDLGAELTRVTDRADGYEFLWSGDPAVWSGRSPLLFPIVGKLKGDRYTHAGQTYSLPKHGFARREVFRCAKQDASSLTFVLDDWEKHAADYPFRWALRVTFSLEGRRIRVRHEVENLDAAAPLYFSLGAHPAIACVDGELRFPEVETIDAWQFGADGLVADEKTPFLHAEARATTSSRTRLTATPTSWRGCARPMWTCTAPPRPTGRASTSAARPMSASGPSPARPTSASSPGRAWTTTSTPRASWPRRRGSSPCPPGRRTPSPSRWTSTERHKKDRGPILGSRSLRVSAKPTRCAHNAPNTGKLAFGPRPCGIHAAAADCRGMVSIPFLHPRKRQKGFLQPKGPGPCFAGPGPFLRLSA